MQLYSNLFLLSFLFASLLSIATAYPAPPGPTIQAGASSKASSSTRNKAVNNIPPKIPPKNPKRPGKSGTTEDKRVGTGTKFGSDVGTSTNDDVEVVGSGKCAVPLAPQYASGLEDGHGCKKIAEAFSHCNVNDCQEPGARKTCLCNQKQIFGDQLVKSCYKFLNGQDAQAAQPLKRYLGLCGV